MKEAPPCVGRGLRSEEPPRWSSAASPPVAKACGCADETSSSTVTEAASLHSRGCSSVVLAGGAPPRAAGSATNGFDSMTTALLRGWTVAGLLRSKSAQV